MRTCCEAIRKRHKPLAVVIGFLLRSQLTTGHPSDARTQQRLRGFLIADTNMPFSEKSMRGQWRWSLVMCRPQRHPGDKAAADNWAWASMATKQHGLSNEINGAVLGLVSPRRGLSPNSPPKVKERTITQTQIQQGHSIFRLSSK